MGFEPGILQLLDYVLKPFSYKDSDYSNFTVKHPSTDAECRKFSIFTT